MSKSKGIKFVNIEVKRDKDEIRDRSTLGLLHDLDNYVNKSRNLPGYETITRMLKHLEQGRITDDDLPLPYLFTEIERFKRGEITIRDLLIIFLGQLENYEAKFRRNELHNEVMRRRDLLTRFEVEMENAAKRRDAIVFLDLQRDKELLEQLPAATRQIDPETVDLAIEVLKLKDQHPRWSYTRIATELFDNPSEAERIKKAVQRTRKAYKKALKS